MYTKEESREKIRELTLSFEAKLDFIKTSKEYKEAQIEDEFIKPLFKYLNWNTTNEGILNPNEREFIVQAKGRNRKEPDYLLQLESKRRFYIEAKHTKYDLQKRTDYIWQAYSYAYSTQTRPQYEKVDFALLTDFEEFRFFDCTFPVKNHETLNNYCVLDWTYKDYIKNFDKLWEYFERENIRNGSLEKLYISEKKIKENRISPDKAFLKDLDDEKNGWRIKLAKDVKKYHPEFSAEFITQTVQLILDRFIFIKVLVDREIEEDYIEKIVNKLKSIKDKEEGIIYEECKDIFEQLDKTYNGSVFTKRTELDAVLVSNKILLDVLKDFLPQNSRYNFKVIPIEILGTIYEQFLGKIVVTTAKQAKIDYKPEVRKAGGVYYTPDYIVDYIVEKTVGEKLKECKKFGDLLEIKICDPACGSGSFLISAYNILIQWTIKYYESKVKTENGTTQLEKLNKEEKTLVYLDGDGNVRLTSKIKRDILKSCIFGVDIDPQAVEVTKMSLSLKTLENTNHYEVYNERTLFHTTILPPLEGNIKCGNSLVGTDYTLMKESLSKVNPFDWDLEFKEIFSKYGGFCIVIGNPPYVFGRDWKELKISQNMKEYLGEKFKYSPYQMDMFSIFMELSSKIVKVGGYVGQIVPNVWLTNSFSSITRTYILENSEFLSLINPGKHVFQSLTVDTIIYILKKGVYNKEKYFNTKILKYLNNENKPNELEISNFLYSDFIDGQKPISTSLNYNKYNLLLKIKNTGKELKEISYITRGVHPYRIGGYGKSAFTKGYQTKKDVSERPYNSKTKIKNYRSFIYGKDLKRFTTPKENNYILYGEWLAEPRESKFFEGKRIYSRKILGERLIVTIEESDSVADQQVYITKPKDQNENLHKYIAGVLASKLISFYIKNLYDEGKDAFPQIKVGQLQSIPLPEVTPDNTKTYNSIVDTVNKLLMYNNNLSRKMVTTASIESELRMINSLEIKLDKLIYSIYKLTPDDIKLIEDDG
ncbi:MAG: N-6 DNA methylase [Leptospiraceae bacterium]|nr:N-6 DNA methylase [Leptospiraceae bacterium]MCP5494900.1 N-6 DNA methylase [Leptospiraceae bacterium]